MGQSVGTQTAALAMEGEYYPDTSTRGSANGMVLRGLE